MKSVPQAIRWQDGKLELLDQRGLPGREIYLRITSIDAAAEAIRTLSVRGAPAIGIAAGYALAQSMREVDSQDRSETLARNAHKLKAARPTAVNLAAAVDRLVALGTTDPAALIREAEAIHDEDRLICQRIGECGLPLITEGVNVLTHCNAGALAVSALGTATAPLYLAHQAGRRFHVWVDETRPLWQGARLTAWELSTSGIDCTLICDHVPASLMAAGKIDLVVVGADRVARNGDTANKIGTLGLAVLARHFGIPFYVACPSTTFDPSTANGAAIPIEARHADEVLGAHAARVRVWNPAFDVTPVDLVSGFITDRGLIESPDQQALLAAFGK